MRKLLSILVTAACVGIACLSSAQSESTGGFQKLTPDRLMKQRAIQHMKRPMGVKVGSDPKDTEATSS